MTQPIRLGDLLVRAGVVSDLDVQRALNEQKRWGGRLGTTLVRMGVLTEDLLVKALAKQLDMPRANLDALSIPPELLARLDRSFCERNTLVPLAVDKGQGRLLLAVADPLGSTAPDELGRALNLRPEVYLAGESQIKATITKLFSAGARPAAPALSQASTPLSTLSSSMPPQSIPPQSVPPQPSFSIPPTGVNGPAPPAPSADAAALKLQELNDLARKQTRAISAVVELLIDKGVVTREEYLSWLAQR